jgi:hypothetical protein
MTRKLRANPYNGRFPGHQGGKKRMERQVKFESKGDLFFFDIPGMVHIDWVPEGQTINQVYYVVVLTTLREQLRKKKHQKCG